MWRRVQRHGGSLGTGGEEGKREKREPVGGTFQVTLIAAADWVRHNGQGRQIND
jgi:hypothetical protein